MKKILFAVAFALFALCGAFPSPAAAQQDDTAATEAFSDLGSLKVAESKCARINDLILRLQCYDHISNLLGFMTQEKLDQTQVTLGKFGFWRASQTVDALGEAITTVRLAANVPVVSPSGVKQYPDFVLRCKRNQTDVYVDWKMPVPKYGYTGIYAIYRLDNGPETSEDWEISEDASGFFSRKPVEFIRALRGHKQISMVFSLPNAGQMSMVFTLSGLDNALNLMIDRCYK